MNETARQLSDAELRALEEEYDPEARFRTVLRPVAILTGVILFLLSVYHFYTAGFGIPRATTHRGLHMGVSLFVIFLSFAAFNSGRHKTTGLAILGIPVVDWFLAIAGAVSSFYMPWIYDQLAFRVGNPMTLDIVMGTLLLVTLM